MSSLSARQVFRAYETDGVPASGAHKPSKQEIIEYLRDRVEARAGLRIRLEADLQLYVRLDGSDANDGSANDSSHAFASRQAAYDHLCDGFDLNGFKCRILLADGTHTAPFAASQKPVGCCTPEDVIFESVSGNKTACRVVTTAAHAFVVTDSVGQFSQAMFTVRKIGLSTISAGDCVLVTGGAVFLDDIDFGVCAGSHINALHHSWIVCISNYSISGGASNGHFAAASSGTVVGHDMTITFLASVSYFAFASVSAHGRVYANNMTFTLGAFSVTGLKYAVSEQGIVYTNYAGENYLPGSLPGVRTTGGRYDGVSDAPQRVPKTGDTTRAATTTLANDPHLKFEMQASKTYQVKIVVKFDAAAAPDFKWALSGPASPSWVRVDKHWRVPGGTAFVSEAADVGAAYPSAKTIAGAASTSGFLEVEARVSNGANAGTFAFQWAQDVSDVSGVTVGITSYLEWQLVS